MWFPFFPSTLEAWGKVGRALRLSLEAGEGKGSGKVTEVIDGFFIIGDCKKVGSICNYVYYLKLSMSYKSYIYAYILLYIYLKYNFVAGKRGEHWNFSARIGLNTCILCSCFVIPEF